MAFLQTTKDAALQGLRARLFSDCAAPVIKESIGYKIGASFARVHDTQETEAAYNNVVLSPLTCLRTVKRKSEDHSINHFRTYVATLTYQACSNHLHENYPQRHTWKNRLRYFLTHEAGVALWES